MYAMVIFILSGCSHSQMDSHTTGLCHSYPSNAQYNRQSCQYFCCFIERANSFFVGLACSSFPGHPTYRFYLCLIVFLLLFSMLLVFLYITRSLIIRPILELHCLSIFLSASFCVHKRSNVLIRILSYL